VTGDRVRVELVSRLEPAVADYPPGSTFGPRTTQHFQFVWLLRGRAVWMCEDHTTELEPGQLLLIRPGMRDSFHWDRDRPTRHGYVHFLLTGRDHLVGTEHWPVVRRTDDVRNPLDSLCRYLLWLSDARPRDWHAQTAAVLELLVHTFVEGPVPADAAPPLPAPVEAMTTHIAGRWSDGLARPLTQRELASAAGVSASSLSRLFRRDFGVGPVAAIELIRLGRAEPLLWMSNLTMAAVATQCGFADAYHFSRRFRAVYGISPSAFREAGPAAADVAPVADAGLRPLERRLRG
jgi:AraC family transcriptional regulator